MFVDLSHSTLHEALECKKKCALSEANRSERAADEINELKKEKFK